MKRGPFSQEQITLLLRQAERGEQTIQPICREAGITETTFYRWRRPFGGMETSQAQRLKTLEQENARLNHLLAERVLEVDALRAVLSKKEIPSQSVDNSSLGSKRRVSPNAPRVVWWGIASQCRLSPPPRYGGSPLGTDTASGQKAPALGEPESLSDPATPAEAQP